MIDEVIKGLEGVEVYLDDVVKFDSTPTQHVASLRAFFSRLRTHDLKLSPPKSVIGTTNADFGPHHLVLRCSPQPA